MLNPELATNRRPIDRAAGNPQLVKLAQFAQPAVQALLGRADARVRDVLHGTPLGHPLHPAITDIPIGSWTLTALFDAMACTGRSDVAFAADASLVVGLLGGVGALATGLAEWSDTDGAPRNLGFAHALLNGAAFTGYATSLVLRQSGRRRAGIVTAFASYVMCGLAGYLGGELAYGLQLGVRHTAQPLEPPSDFTRILGEDALPATGAVRADFAGVPLLLSRLGKGVAAISAVCTHRGGPLDEGAFEDGCVRCPWHGSMFRLADGAVVRGPASFPAPRFEARLRDGAVEVRALQER